MHDDVVIELALTLYTKNIYFIGDPIIARGWSPDRS